MRTIKPFLRIAAALILHGPLNQAQAQASAQRPLQPPEFEVASIKPNKTNERMYYGLRNSTLTVRNMTVKGLIQTAYGKRDFQITGGPAWITSEHFDIDAKAERPQKATHDMEKRLLASRFQMELHRETKEAYVYSLVIAPGGLKMEASSDQTEPEKGGPKELAPGRIIGEGIPMYVIANLLSSMLGRTVVDNTGLTGKFDVNLRPVADPLPSQAGTDDPPTQADLLNLAIVDAIEKQLGLKVRSMKAADEVLVIDHIEHPSVN